MTDYDVLFYEELERKRFIPETRRSAPSVKVAKNCATCFPGYYGDLACVRCEHRQIYLTLPQLPPSVNHYWRHAVVKGHASIFVTADGRAFQKLVISLVRAQKLNLGITTPVGIKVVLRPPDGARRDLDNFAGKSLMDALTRAGVWKDDSQVQAMDLRWGPKIKGGQTDIHIYHTEDLRSPQRSLLEV